MRSLPRVRFKLPSVKRETEVLAMFCKPHESVWDWSDVVYKSHPELKTALQGKKTARTIYAAVYAYASRCITQDKESLEEIVATYQEEWDEIQGTYLKILSDLMETDYPKDRKIITAYVSIVPIYPRFLYEWAFNVGSRNHASMVPIAMHEILHFLYFKKWLEVFPNTRRRELDAPYLVWKLSEILDPIILNNTREIQALRRHKHEQYEEFEGLKIGKKSLVRHFEELYRNHLKTKTSFEDFLKIAWSEAQKHRRILENV